MIAPIRALETSYKGYRFRSRLEARWAVYFDALGIEWDYEPQGFDLGDGVYYLPDFWLPPFSMWAEVKPKEFLPEELDKARRLADGSGYGVIQLIGMPADRCYPFVPPRAEVADDGFLILDPYHLRLDRLGIKGIEGLAAHIEAFAASQRAIAAARSARFEGMRPARRRRPPPPPPPPTPLPPPPRKGIFIEDVKARPELLAAIRGHLERFERGGDVGLDAHRWLEEAIEGEILEAFGEDDPTDPDYPCSLAICFNPHTVFNRTGSGIPYCRACHKDLYEDDDEEDEANAKARLEEFEEEGDFSLRAHEELDEDLALVPLFNPHSVSWSEAAGMPVCLECGFLDDDDDGYDDDPSLGADDPESDENADDPDPDPDDPAADPDEEEIPF